LFNVAGGTDLSMSEVNEAAQIITESIDRDAKVIFGAVVDEKLRKGEIKITVVATGFDATLEDRQPALVESGALSKGKDNKDEIEFEKTPLDDGEEDVDFQVPAFLRRRMK